MKTMKQFIIATTFVVGAMILFQGCVPEEGWALPGSPINFKATSGQGKSLKTKTVFSGDRFEVDNVPMERIDWLTGDKIRIWSDKATYHYDTNLHYADYRVTGVTTHQTSGENDNISIATINPDGIGGPEHGSGNGLEWSTGEHEFYSIYPSPYEREDAGVALLEHPNKFKLTFPATQTYTQDGTTLKPNMDYAYMYAAVKTAVEAEVNLAFQPMFTALQFTVDSEHDATMTLNSFTITSASKALCGELTAMLTAIASGGTAAYTFPEASDDNKSVTITFGSGVEIVQDSPVTFTAFVLPQDYDDLSISFETSAGKKMLDLTQTIDEVVSGIPFAAGFKYNINLGGLPGAFDYSLQTTVSATNATEVSALEFDAAALAFGGDMDFTVRSYRTRQANGDKFPVPWKVLVSNDNGLTWVDHDSEDWPSWLSLSAYEGVGGTDRYSYENIKVHVIPDPQWTETTENGTVGVMAALRAAELAGDKNHPRDLSLFDIYGTPHPGGIVTSITKSGSHTSNCYVLNRPGWFCFPLVYGNAIDMTRGNASGVNTAAYSKYVNVDNRTITSPFILNDLNINASDCDAVVLWQDQVASAALIREDVDIINAPAEAGLNCPYIRFHIDERYIVPGNAVIALRDKNKRIIWSWHIWVTTTPHENAIDLFKINSMKFRTENTTSTGSLSSTDILNCNLGWTAPMKYTIKTAGSSLIKIVQDWGQPLEKNMDVSYGQGDVYEAIYASGTYYQWGRKDPFLPSNGNSGATCTNRACHSPSGYSILETNNRTYGVDRRNLSAEVDAWISNPYTFDTYYSPSIPNEELSDLWNSVFENSDYPRNATSEMMNMPVHKTVYDPCPPGFCVPLGRSYTGFTTDGTISPIETDWNLFCGATVAVNPDLGRPASWYFSNEASRNEDTYILFFPGAGVRAYNNGRLGVGTTNSGGFYWTAVPSNEYYCYGVCIAGVDFTNPRLHTTYRGMRSEGMAIRPMLEMDGIIVTGENLSGWDN